MDPRHIGTHGEYPIGVVLRPAKNPLSSQPACNRCIHWQEARQHRCLKMTGDRLILEDNGIARVVDGHDTPQVLHRVPCQIDSRYELVCAQQGSLNSSAELFVRSGSRDCVHMRSGSCRDYAVLTKLYVQSFMYKV